MTSLPSIEPVDLRAHTAVTRRTVARRVVRIGTVTTRRLGPVALRWPRMAKDKRGDVLGKALYETVADLGVTFVKLGQLLASSPSVAGEAVANAMRGVLDDGPSIPMADVRRVVERDLGRPMRDVFASFDERPFAAASLAVVHRARLLDGTDVAVKVLRPNSATIVTADMRIVQPLVRRLALALPVGFLPMLPQIVGGLAEQLAEELDLRNEARVMAWFTEMVELIGAKDVAAPRPIFEASGQRVLTMEYVEGSTIDDLAFFANESVDAGRAIEALIEAWFALTLCTGVFHGDVHAGNLRITPEGTVVLLDWGIVGRLPDASRTFFRRSLEGALGDESAWVDVRDHLLSSFDADALAMTGLTPDDFLQLVRAQTLMIMTQPFSELNLTMLMPQSTPLPDAAPTVMPTTKLGWLRFIRSERKRMRNGGAEAMIDNAPPRSELLLIKQLVFFERYGKMFLGDQPLIYDPDVYRSLLAMPAV